MRDFKKYHIWKLSHDLTLEIYKLTQGFPKEELYGLTSQLRCASSSIPSNISEGCGSASDAEFNEFLTLALGSACKTEYLIILAKDLAYLDDNLVNTLIDTINLIKSKTYQLQQKLTNA